MEFKKVLTYGSIAGAGVLVGAVADRIIFSTRRTFGTLKVDKTNPEKEMYSIEFDNLDCLSNKKRVILKVETIN